MKRALFVLFVLTICVAGWLRERATEGAERGRLALGPVPTPEFEDLAPPIGAEVLRGRVLDPDGTGCGGLEIVLSPPVSTEDGDSSASPLHWTTTAEDGSFVFDELQPGSYIAILSQANREPVRREVEIPVPGDLVWKLEKGPLAPLDALPEVRRADLAGRVDSPDRPSIQGRPPGPIPTEGFQILLLPDDPDPMRLTGVTKRRTSVSADGTFRFEGVVAGSYHIELLPPFARDGSWPVLDRVAVEVDPAGSASPRLTIRGGTISGKLVDPEGRPIEGALVEAWPLAQPTHRWPVRSTDQEGVFWIDHLPPDTYTLRVRAGAGVLEERVEVLEGANRQLELAPLDPRGSD
ncbi:MAG TPA: carboxypeptidase regulatory-like domain-containing protein [Planctomycetes bacterium]|nr:carboxypeptidase regulatory-like domain-containing protein [Planctomycetota bacterium]